MKNDNMKQERRRKSMHCSIKCYLYKPDTQQEYFKSNSEPKKPKSIAGFKSGLIRHNAVILLNIPPPPRHIYKTFKSMNKHNSKNKTLQIKSRGFFRTRSQRLREDIFHLIEKTSNDLRVQTDATNFDFRKRVYEMKRAKEELEYQMKKVSTKKKSLTDI